MKEGNGGYLQRHVSMIVFHIALSSVNEIKSWYNLMKNVSDSEGLLMQIQN
jgi:hypothetical protein